MDLNLFKNKVKKENILTIDGVDYDKSNIMGGVNFNQTVNAGTDIVLGSCTVSSIEFQLNNLNNLINNLAGKEITWKIRVEGYPDIQVGIFIAEKPTRINDTRIKVKAYDRMIKFDKIVGDWLRTISYPTTLKNMLTGLCNYVGVPLVTTAFLNDNYPVKFNFLGTNVKGRDVLKWIAEIAAKYAVINELGQLRLGWYNSIVYSVNNSNYYNVKVEDYTVKKIDKLQVQVEENDIGVVVGTGTNAYVIQNNPLLYAATDAEIRPYVELIYNAIKDFTYIPFEIKLNVNPLIKAGNSFQVTTRKGQVFNAVVMTRKMTSGNDVYSATGNASRAVNKSLNQSIRQLRGKTNVLDRTIERTISKLYDADTGDFTVLTQTVNSLESRISSNETDIEEVVGTTDVIANRLLSAENSLSEVDGNITDAMNNAINSANSNTDTLLLNYSTTNQMDSAISQSASQINLSVDGKITDTIGLVNQTTDTKLLDYSTTTEMNSAIDLKADSITLTVKGYTDQKIEEIELLPGPQGEPGLPGTKGDDGITYYTWIKYADTPTTGMDDSPDNKKYIGIAVNKTTDDESIDYSDYKWSLIKGEQGIQGDKGENGQPTYTWVKYADTPTSGMSDSPDGKLYIGLAFNKDTQTKSVNYADYAWSLMPQNIDIDGIVDDIVDGRLTEYYTKTEVNTAINVSKNTIDLSVDQKINETATTINARTDEVLESYSTTNEMNSAINLSAQSIELSVSQKIISTYRQSYEPSQPKNGEFWYRTTDGKMLRFNGVIWELVEDGAISQINSEIASLTISTSNIISRVEDAEDNVSLAVQTIDTFSNRIQSIEANMDFKYQQDTPPENPEVGDVWLNTNPDGFIVDLLTMTVDEMIQQVEYYGQTLNKSYRWDGTNWQHVEDGAITELRQNVSEFEQTVNSISATVTAYDDRIGNLELTADSLTSRISTTEGNISTIIQTATNLTSRITNTEGNVSTLQQTATSLTSRVSSAEGDISTLEQTATSLTSRISSAEGNISTVTQTASSLSSRLSTAEGNISSVTQTASSLSSRVTDAEGNISTIQQTASGITAAVNNSKLIFDTTGLTVKNGGFKILDGSTKTMGISSSGVVELGGGKMVIYATPTSDWEVFKADSNGRVLSRGLYVINPNQSVVSSGGLYYTQRTILSATGGLSGQVLIGYGDYSRYLYSEDGTYKHIFAGGMDIGRSTDNIKIAGVRVKWGYVSGTRCLIEY